MNKKLIDYYSTSDLSLTTTISLWFPIREIDRSNPSKVTFRFKKTKKLEKLLDLYWRHELMVEPYKYFNQLKTLKARLYSER